MVNLPFIEESVGQNTFIREFKHDTDSGEFSWHRDREDRIIEPLHDTDWMLQIEDELPKVIAGEVFIPKGVYHRVIKGQGNLRIKLKKLI